MNEQEFWIRIWTIVAAVIVAVLISLFTYNYLVIKLKVKALESGTPASMLECVDPGASQFAACAVLAATK